ncbi:MAG: S4 domain-containing protein, partial [Nitrospirota bacterium]
MEEAIIVAHKEAFQRIDHFLIKKGLGISRTRIQQLIKGGVVTVNLKSVKPNYKVHPMDRILLDIPPREKMDISPEEIPLEILFEDDHILAVNKPPNMVVHPAPGNYSGTLVNALLFYFNELSRVGRPERPG